MWESLEGGSEETHVKTAIVTLVQEEKDEESSSFVTLIVIDRSSHSDLFQPSSLDYDTKAKPPTLFPEHEKKHHGESFP